MGHTTLLEISCCGSFSIARVNAFSTAYFARLSTKQINEPYHVESKCKYDVVNVQKIQNLFCSALK